MITTLILSLLFQADVARLFHDDRGYAFTRSQTEEVVRLSREIAAAEFPPVETPKGPWIAAVCPHDDHALAGPVYARVMEGLQAKRVILIGVNHHYPCHRAPLIFDDFSGWNGPSGFVPVEAEFRTILEEAVRKLTIDNRTIASMLFISGRGHEDEHSLEAMIPWIQQSAGETQIVPLIVSPMPWASMETLADSAAAATAVLMKDKGWILGRDVQVLISNDATHYGDQGWGGKNHAPYGTGCEGLAKATANDRRLIETYLEGPLQSERLKGLLYELVEEKELSMYKVTWCGRFAVPFGLEFIRRLSEKMGMPVPEGKLLAYSTSVELGQLEVEDLPPTAPANLRHWVGYAAMGWWAPEEGR
jgi:AmmeMemoRadiSam system protein B